MTLVGDALKGAIPVLIARAAGFPRDYRMGRSGRVYRRDLLGVPLLSRRQRHRCGLGVWLAISPMVNSVRAAAFIVVFAISRIVSLSSICASIVLPPAVAILGLPHEYLLLAILMAALALFRHRENIKRLSRGEEPKFQLKRSEQCCVLANARRLIGRPPVKHPCRFLRRSREKL